MRMMQVWVAAMVVAAVGGVCAAEGEELIERRPAAKGAAGGGAGVAWNQAETVFVGELSEAKAGPVSMSMPPIHSNTLTFSVEKVLRGAADEKAVTCSHSHRGNENYPYEVGKKYIVALSAARNMVTVTRLEVADAEAVKAAELACALPAGWATEGGKAVSPWASIGKAAWAAEGVGFGEVKVKCEKTGRPALLAGAKVTWSAEKVAPKKEIQWTNPDGDGEYTLTVTNLTDGEVTVPALLSQDGKVLWKESVVVLCQGKAYAWPGAKGVSGKVSPTTLKAKESVSTTINALALKGPEWPRGGYRIEFTFCLGEKGKTESFYYMSRHHDALRDAALKGVGAGGKEGK